MDADNGLSVTRWIREIPVPAALISYIYRATQRKFANGLVRYHIGWGHFAILMILKEEEGRSQDSIALSRGFDKTMIAKSVVRLEEEGLIYRVTDPDDKRVKRLYLTDAGRAISPEISCIGLGINASLFRGFTEEEVHTFLTSLRKIAMNASEQE